MQDVGTILSLLVVWLPLLGILSVHPRMTLRRAALVTGWLALALWLTIG